MPARAAAARPFRPSSLSVRRPPPPRSDSAARALSRRLAIALARALSLAGACTVDCGGPRRVVCDTGPWPDVFADSGSVDVVVTITEGFKTYERTCWNCFRYYAVDGALSPRLRRVSPRHAGAGDALMLEGENFGDSIRDYLAIYLGVGRPPQGANLILCEADPDTGARVCDKSSHSTHALCRPDDLNLAIDDVTGKPTFGLPASPSGRALREPVCALPPFASSFSSSRGRRDRRRLAARHDRGRVRRPQHAHPRRRE